MDGRYSPYFRNILNRDSGTRIEFKENSLVWHYRKADPELASGRVVELKTVLSSLISDTLSVMDMDKALEIMENQVNKGNAVAGLINEKNYDFILCAGDDVTDENMFTNLPDSAITIKVGKKLTEAKYFTDGIESILSILSQFTAR